MNGNGQVHEIKEPAKIKKPKFSDKQFQHTQNMDHKIAIDIGGTLAKVVYWTESPTEDRLQIEYQGGYLQFKSFLSKQIDILIEFLKENCNLLNEKLLVTGGGAYKFCELMESQLNVKVQKVDEMLSLNKGLKFLISMQQPFTYSEAEGYSDLALENPCLYVNIGSGVSILKIDHEEFSRVSGTCVGGGTLLGIASYILKTSSYDEILALAAQGSEANVDLLMNDIYGTDINPAFKDIIAVSLGKIAMAKDLNFAREDIARSLVNMIAYNIGQIGYLNAKLHSIKQILFGGNFLRGQEYSMDKISFGVKFWSKGEMTAMFMKHDGYLGALGAIMDDTDTKV